MKYTREEVLEYCAQDDVRFIRLAFCDLNGKQKNIAILPCELQRAFDDGISFDASAIDGFTDEVHSDLFLFPIPSTLTVLPWRSMQGKVVRMFCEIRYPNGDIYEKDSRSLLARTERKAREMGLDIEIGAEMEFYLFRTDEKGEPTKVPFDKAGYMDVAPEDKGENIRREICQYLTQMGITPEASHHEEGPGQNEIDFRHSTPLKAADNCMNFKTVVKAVAEKSGLYADFSPKPLENHAGNGFHINLSLVKEGVSVEELDTIRSQFMAGILAHIKDMTAFLNPREDSYIRLGKNKAPRYITWSRENRSQLIRVPAYHTEAQHRMELRSADPTANPYLAFSLLINAGLDGIEKKLVRGEPVNENLYTAGSEITRGLETLPSSLKEAKKIAADSEFITSVINL
ncbi:MAG: glutamine synthetase family protein [Treponemataceae bacterium]|nr:glutamine synthetase family protein [Treponemataceae bacterium]